MKFDLIISNPPYNHNLDLKILKEVYEFSDKICFVHPVGWLYYQKPSHHLYYSIRDMVKDHLESVYIFRTHEYFNAFTWVPSAITFFNKQCVAPIDVNSFDLHGNSEIYKSLKRKILSYSYKNNLLHNIEYKKNKKQKQIHKKYQVGLPEFAPGGKTVFIQKTDESMHIGKGTKYPIKFFFDTIDECIIFKDYLKTKMARFCLSIYKINQCLHAGAGSGEIASVPYMPTYTRPWSDEEVAAELGLTDEELTWAINWIPDYYPEDKEKYAKYIK